ncbi:MAG TPA: MEDS domain-containing protein [Candidatus Dormibacteraeota bacterium]|nr:MEDS domain-containing protein [Candidatus Dormibacteraeota bacterium]
MRPGDHCCLAFLREDDQREIMAAFVGEGLATGHQVLYLADGVSSDAVLAWLAGRGLSPLPAVRSGQLVVAPVTEALLAGGRFDPDEAVGALHRRAAAAHACGYAGLRVAGEMGWALGGVPGSHRLLDFEARLQRLAAGDRIAALCQYDLRRFTEEELADIEALHGGRVGPDPMYADGLLRISRSLLPAGLVITGDIDASNVEPVAEALAVATAVPGDIHLDVSGLAFCDIGGFRAIVAAGRNLHGGRRIVLHGLSRQLRRVVRLVGWDAEPGLAIGTR